MDDTLRDDLVTYIFNCYLSVAKHVSLQLPRVWHENVDGKQSQLLTKTVRDVLLPHCAIRNDTQFEQYVLQTGKHCLERYEVIRKMFDRPVDINMVVQMFTKVGDVSNDACKWSSVADYDRQLTLSYLQKC